MFAWALEGATWWVAREVEEQVVKMRSGRDYTNSTWTWSYEQSTRWNHEVEVHEL